MPGASANDRASLGSTGIALAFAVLGVFAIAAGFPLGADAFATADVASLGVTLAVPGASANDRASLIALASAVLGVFAIAAGSPLGADAFATADVASLWVTSAVFGASAEVSGAALGAADIRLAAEELVAFATGGHGASTGCFGTGTLVEVEAADTSCALGDGGFATCGGRKGFGMCFAGAGGGEATALGMM